MIKKISQLNPLPPSTYDKEGDAEAKRKIEEMMFEVSYETATPNDINASADEVNYYTSYSVNLSAMKDFLTIYDIWDVLALLSSGGLSVISENLVIGTKGDEPGKSDRLSSDGHKYYPDIDHHITAYSDINLENKLTVHGESFFHNNVVISCDDSPQGSYPNVANPILKVGGVAKFDNVIDGVAYRAKWGDLAEYYSSDAEYGPGTLVKFGGEKEVTIATDVANGVVTTNPGVVLNDKEESETSVGVALVGKVPVKVRGPVRKFDKIVLSRTDPGIGVVYNYAPFNEVIARALEENLDKEEKLVMCATKFNLR